MRYYEATGCQQPKWGPETKQLKLACPIKHQMRILLTPKHTQTQGLYPRMMNNDDIHIMERDMYIHMII